MADVDIAPPVDDPITNPDMEKKLELARAQATASRLKDETLEAAVKNSPAYRNKVEGDRRRAMPSPPRRPEDTKYDTGIAPLDAFTNFTSDMQRVFAGELTRGGSEHITSLMSGNTTEEELQERENARIRTGMAGDVAAGVGQMAPYFLLGKGAYSTGPKAFATGGAAAVADTTLRKGMEEGRLPSMPEVALSFGLGSMASVGMYFMGKMIQGAAGGKPTVSADTAKALEDLNAREAAYSAVLSSNKSPKLNGKYFNDMADRLEAKIRKNVNMNMAYRSGADPTIGEKGEFARQAIARIRGLSRGNITFGYAADEAFTIFNSIRNLDRQVVVNSRDAQMVDMIYKELDDYLMSLSGKIAHPKGQFFRREGISEAVENYAGLKGIKTIERKTEITLGILTRAAYLEAKGIPYDRAVQTEMQSFLRPGRDGKMKTTTALFSKEELAAFKDMAEGGTITRGLNVLDHAYGYNVLGHFHRTYSLFTRSAHRASKEAEVRAATNLVNPSVPTTASMGTVGLDLAPELGAAAGAAVVPGQVPRVEERIEKAKKVGIVEALMPGGLPSQ